MQRTWHRGLEGGGKKVDDEHRLQVDLADVLENLLRRGDDPETARRTLQQLAEFSSAHFRAEELLMEFYRYAGYEAHAGEHRRFVEGLREIAHSVAAGDGPRALERIDAWRSALVVHIQDVDGDFARLERGISYARSL